MVPPPGLIDHLPPGPVTAVLAGPTAAGKTSLALELARLHRQRTGNPLELVNADSLLVYRGMDIGTAKPSRAELEEIPHHLVDIREPDEPFTAGDFVRAVESALQGIHARGRRALVVGGTGFYLKALFHGMWEGPAADAALRARLEQLPPGALHDRLRQADPASALRIGPHDRYRLVRAIELLELSGKTPSQLEAERTRPADPRFRLWIVDRAAEELNARIRQRAEQMLREGLVAETRALRERYPAARALGAVGYKETCAHLDGVAPAGRKIPDGIEGLQQEIELSTRQLVKRQRTWFRNLRAGLGDAAKWFDLPESAQNGEVESEYGRLYAPPAG